MFEELFYDDASFSWNVLFNTDSGPEEVREVRFVGCSPDNLDKKSGYECDATKGEDDGVIATVTEIGDVVWTEE